MVRFPHQLLSEKAAFIGGAQDGGIYRTTAPKCQLLFQQFLKISPNRVGIALNTGEFLRKAREGRGLSLRAVARMLGQDHSYLSLMERGKVSATVEMLERVCPVYGVQPWEAVAGKTKEELFREIASPVVAERGPDYQTDPLIEDLKEIAKDPEARKHLADLLELARKEPRKLESVAGILRIMLEDEQKKDRR